MIGENSYNLVDAQAEIPDTSEQSYRYVKICELIPFLYDLAYISLADGDFHIQLRLQD